MYDNAKESMRDMLCALLGCSPENLKILKKGSDGLCFAIDGQIEYLESKIKAQELTEDEKTELVALQTLDPNRDIQVCFDHGNTHIRFARNGSIYRKYLSNAIDEFEHDVGLKIADAGNARRRNSF